ncbi:MAG: sulfatase [Nitrososphaerota archaeon]|nr:sulfatase [Nitrososphaerota archaeon]MDG6983721.1 sulfatase [Nitrososphaerota archaeon]
MNIILIVSDTFRYDHLRCNGNKTMRTPYLDKLASNSVVFDRAYANSHPTVPARADLVTGKYTFTFMGWQPLPTEEITLAQLLAQKGYLTTAVADTPFLVKESYNYDRGFQDFIYIRGQDYKRAEGYDVRPYRVHETDYAAPATMLAAERWLQRHYKEKFFLYVDTWDPHEPWDPPHWYTELYHPDYDGKVIPPVYGKYKERGVSDEDLEIAHACYCGEATMVDRWVGRLLDTVEALNLAEKTAIIFTSDHGFYFGEHGYFGKSVMDRATGTYGPAMIRDTNFYRSPLYEEVIHVPMLVSVPGCKPRRTNAIVSLSDVVPTILDLAEVEAQTHVQGQSIVPILQGDDDAGKPFVVTSWPLHNPGEVTRAVDAFGRNVKEWLPVTVTTNEWSLIYSARHEPVELYHLSTDPKQQNNIASTEPERVKELHAMLLSLLKNCNTSARLLEPRSELE